jgi:Putative transposase DNA-binding domain
LAGFNSASKKRKLWLSKSEEIKAFNENVPTSKVMETARYEEYLRYLLPRLETVLIFYNERRWRRLRFGSYIGKQKAFDQLTRRFIHRYPRAVVAFGSAMFDHASRGHKAGPVKGFKKELEKRCKVVLVGEYLTSQICSVCHKRFDPRQPLYAAKQCRGENPECRIQWNRDVNAARNIRDIYLNGSRPPIFDRNQQRHQPPPP